MREEGNTLILSIVLSAVAIALVLTFGTITQMQIERKRLLALTDAAALYAATALDESAYFTEPGAEIVLTDATVRGAVHEYVAQLPLAQRGRFEGLALSTPTAARDAHTAEVTMSAFVRPGFIPWSITPFEGFRIEVTSAARAD